MLIDCNPTGSDALLADFVARHRGFVQATYFLRQTVRASASTDAQIILARYRLGLAIRERRSAVASLHGALKQLPLQAEFERAQLAKTELLDVALPYLGRWSASAIARDPSGFIDATAPLFQGMMDLSSTEATWLSLAVQRSG